MKQHPIPVVTHLSSQAESSKAAVDRIIATNGGNGSPASECGGPLTAGPSQSEAQASRIESMKVSKRPIIHYDEAVM